MTVVEVAEAVEAVVTPGAPSRLFLKQGSWPVPLVPAIFLSTFRCPSLISRESIQLQPIVPRRQLLKVGEVIIFEPVCRNRNTLLFLCLLKCLDMSRRFSFALAAVLTLFLAGSCNKSGTAEHRRTSTSQAYPKAKRVTRIVQYNVGVFSKEVENSIPMVAAMMKEIGADAMSLNELDSCNTRHPNNQLADFAVAMGGWNHNFSRAMSYHEGAYGVGIAVPDAILDCFTIPLPQGEGSEPRACSVVETRKYVLASTHLDYVDEPSMVIQARTINEALAEKYSKSKKPVFLAGDMNSTQSSKVLSELKQKWNVLSCIKNTYSAINPHECIDFILALQNGAKYKVVGSDVPVYFNGGDVGVASDHLPVFVDVKL